MPRAGKKSPTADDPSPKRAAILRAAIELFRRYGFRRTSIDAIATEAKVAKPTIYAHFADKDALYVAVCAHVMDAVIEAAEAAARLPGAVEARVAAVLAAKFTAVFEIVHTTPHAAELLDSQSALAHDVVARADARFERILLREIERAVRARELDPSRVRLSPRELVAVLMQAGHGATYGVTTADAHRKSIARLVRAILGGASARATRSTASR